MAKRGDMLFGFAILVLIVCIILLLIPLPISVVMNVLIGAFVLGFVFALISQFAFPGHGFEEESDKVKEIRELITKAEGHIDHDIQKSVDVYKDIKSHYSGLQSHEKSQILHDIMRLYLKLLESLHLKR